MKQPEPGAQLPLALRAWGGARRGAGRKPSRDEPARHDAREPFSRSQPVHVTIRLLDHVWNLRSERSFAVVRGALERARRRVDFAVVHFAVQGNHLHLVVEADGPAALANGVRALGIALARGLDRLMGRSGPIFLGRYHAHVLRTPAEARNALRYVLGNHASHARRRGEPLSESFIDRYSSNAFRLPRTGQLALWAERPVDDARTWLLRTASDRPAT